MNQVVVREAKILAEVNRQEPKTREWMLSAIAEMGGARNKDSVTGAHVKNMLEKCPDREAFAKEVERYTTYHIYGTKEESDPKVAEARSEARAACYELGKIIYGD